jgi:hypothetical protein
LLPALLLTVVVQVAPWIAAFTRRREIFIGRIAMVGGS